MQKTGNEDESMIMDYRVLQMHATEDAKDYIFRPSRELILSAKTVYPPPLELYGAAYTGKASALDPEELYCIYNDDFPRREKARSLSVSDIIEYTFPSGERFRRKLPRMQRGGISAAVSKANGVGSSFLWK